MKLLQARLAENYKYETVYTRDAKINTQTITHTHIHICCQGLVSLSG